MTRFEDIKAFAFDVDGVFTDGLVLAMPDGDLLRQFNSKDCYAVPTVNLKAGPHQMVKRGGNLEVEFARNALQFRTQIVVERTKLRKVESPQTIHVMRNC